MEELGQRLEKWNTETTKIGDVYLFIDSLLLLSDLFFFFFSTMIISVFWLLGLFLWRRICACISNIAITTMALSTPLRSVARRTRSSRIT